MNKQQIIGHACALFTTVIWGVTFVSSKVLLAVITPFQLLFLRVLLATITLYLIRPKRLVLQKRTDDLYFIAAALTGVLMYFAFENTSLLYTTASNCSVIVSVAPMFIVLVQRFLGHERAIGPLFVTGFVLAMAGIMFITYSDLSEVSFGSFGDILAILAAVVWGFYTFIIDKLGRRGYDTIQVTKRMFTWSLLFTGIAMLITSGLPSTEVFVNPIYISNILFLGIFASGVCFVTWGLASKFIGPTRTGVYIYMQPIITVLVAVLFINEKLTLSICVGIVLTLVGLILSNMQRVKTRV